MPAAHIPLNSDSMIELSHESLMRIWNKLAIWVEDEFESASMYKRLSEAAAMYQIGKTGLGRPPDLQLALNYVPAFGENLFLINNDAIDAITGTFAPLNGAPANLTEDAIFSLVSSVDSQSYDFRISYLGEFYADNVNVGNDVVLVAVPEPGAGVFLLGTAVFGLLSRRRRSA